jgi:ribonuclease BN (tRNA processing enzyme)
MRIVTLGTNGVCATKTGNTSCILLDTEECYVILDAGDGIHKAKEYLKEAKPTHIFLSHFHLDHIFGLHLLDEFEFESPLRIYGKRGAKEALNLIINKPFSRPLGELPYEVRIEELDEGEHGSPFRLSCRLLPHKDPSLGYRLELDGKTIAYCTDTGPHENILELARGADVLISECALKPGRMSEEWPHMNPEEAARVAKGANVKLLILTHFNAAEYKTMKEREEGGERAKGIFKDSIVAVDGMELEL